MDSDLPLDDLVVIDLTVARAGPTYVRQVADWGANVIRIDPPRGESPESHHDADTQNLHRKKRSLSLDLKSDARRDVLYRLVDRADVLIENIRPSVKGRLGFDYDTVHARNPRLVHGSISGFGQDGPDVRTPTPFPGEHSAAILREFGFDDGTIAELRREGVIPEEQT